jgi:hypothetical protein
MHLYQHSKLHRSNQNFVEWDHQLEIEQRFEYQWDWVLDLYYWLQLDPHLLFESQLWSFLMLRSEFVPISTHFFIFMLVYNGPRCILDHFLFLLLLLSWHWDWSMQVQIREHNSFFCIHIDIILKQKKICNWSYILRCPSKKSWRFKVKNSKLSWYSLCFVSESTSTLSQHGCVKVHLGIKSIITRGNRHWSFFSKRSFNNYCLICFFILLHWIAVFCNSFLIFIERVK